ncbi:MAG: endolytic transglycosylase MltG [Bacteroidetes bacterium]|nr:MAG: endolytic transglycosylase MltG [Bacteroidota bacterium]
MISLSGVKASLFGGFFLSLSMLIVVFLVPNTGFVRQVYDLEVLNPMSSGEVIRQLEIDIAVRNSLSFRLATWALCYNDTIPQGLFQIQKGWNNLSIIKHLKTDPKSSVSVVIRPYQRRLNTLKSLCKHLDIKYTALKEMLEDKAYIQQWGNFNKENVYCLLIPDTLLIYRDSRAKEVADRLFRNYLRFWNAERLQRAAALGLTNQEAGVLASIVYAETKIPQEMPLIAGLYLNRLQKNMRLQADPTVVFASGKTLTRVLKTHKQIRSEYNTYRIYGFPPGPVFTATPQAIDAVLSAVSHNYLYFCARNDFSGYHHFSRTLDEHLQIARQYQKELNRRRIGFKGS